MKIDQLVITQSGLRDVDQLKPMIKWIKSGERFNNLAIDEFCRDKDGQYQSPVIQISRFPDSKLYVADGHHRTLAVWIAGREYLHSDEYIIADWSYEDYLEINFKNNWVTPFDPRTHFRFPDFLTFKKSVREKLLVSEDAAKDFILKNSNLYVQIRKFSSVKDMGVDLGLIIAVPPTDSPLSKKP